MKSSTPQSQNPGKSRNIWITGASSGIGEAAAIRWAAQGTTLVLSGLTTEQIEPVAAKCETKGAKVHIIPFDLTKEVEIIDY